MSNRRQKLQKLSLRHTLLISCTIALFLSSSWAFSNQSRSGSLLSSYGLTDQQFENKAKEYLGVPYRKGGTSKKGMDCSGFARILYDNIFNIELPHSSVLQYRFSELTKISNTGLQPGDLVFFGNKGKKKINHVGVYLSKGEFIHASSSQGITVSRLGDQYWKKRFVGSKRHVELNSNQEVKQLRLENSLEIPVNQHGTMSGYVRHEFQSYSSTFLENDPDLFTDEFYPISKFDSSNLSFYQVGYNHSITNGLNVNVAAFNEKFNPSTFWSDLDHYSQNGMYWRGRYSSDPVARWGVTLSTDIHPSDWLSISPSITYFDNSLAIQEDWNAPRRAFGLNSLLTPSNGRWSLAMMLQYSDQQDLDKSATIDNMFSKTEMAVKLGLNLTENLQFSVIGKHDVRTTYDNPEGSLSSQISASDVFFTFDFTY